jgi:hypothetical protein
MVARVGAVPHRRELAVKMLRQIMKNRLRPSRLTNHPLMGRTMAFDTRYDVSTQVLWSLVAPRLPAI